MKSFYINGNNKFYHQYGEFRNRHKRFGEMWEQSDNPNFGVSFNRQRQPKRRTVAPKLRQSAGPIDDTLQMSCKA